MEEIFSGPLLVVESGDSQFEKRDAWNWLEERPFLEPTLALLRSRHIILHKTYDPADMQKSRERSSTLPGKKNTNSEIRTTTQVEEITLSEVELVSAFEDIEDEYGGNGVYKSSQGPVYMFCVQIRQGTGILSNKWFSAPDKKTRQTWIHKIQEVCATLGTQNEEDNKWEIDFSNLIMGEKIGAGAFGDVYKAQLWGTDVAIKILKQFDEYSEEAKEGLDDLRKEVEVISALRHPNTVLYIGCTKPPHTSLITEYCNNGTLHGLVRNYECILSMDKIVDHAFEIALGMNYLHSLTPQLIHRDLKSENILVDQHFTMKVADFGFSYARQKRSTKSGSFSPQVTNTGHYGIYGTPQWMAPEVMHGDPYNEKVDVYSYGIILVEMVKRQEPYVEMGFEHGDFLPVVTHVARENKRPIIPDWVPIPMKTLIQHCLHEEPKSRPSFGSVLSKLRKLKMYCQGEHFFAQCEGPRIKFLLESKSENLQKAALYEIESMECKGDKSIFQLPKSAVVNLLERLTQLMKGNIKYWACKTLAVVLQSKHMADDTKFHLSPSINLNVSECNAIMLANDALQIVCQILLKEEEKDPTLQRVTTRLNHRPSLDDQVETTLISTLKQRLKGPSKNKKRISSSVPLEISEMFTFSRVQDGNTVKSPIAIEAERVLIALASKTPLELLAKMKDDEMSFIDEALSGETVVVAESIAKQHLKLDHFRNIINVIRKSRDDLPKQQKTISKSISGSFARARSSTGGTTRLSSRPRPKSTIESLRSKKTSSNPINPKQSTSLMANPFQQNKHSSYLKKHTGIGRRSQTRFFVIDAEYIVYYSNDSLKEKKGSISLASILNIKSDSEKDNIFWIQTHDREYCLEANTLDVKKKWITCLKNIISSDTGIQTQKIICPTVTEELG